MASLTVSGSISNVSNGRYVVQVRLLDFDGAVMAEASSPVVEVTSNAHPLVGPPSVAVS